VRKVCSTTSSAAANPAPTSPRLNSVSLATLLGRSSLPAKLSVCTPSWTSGAPSAIASRTSSTGLWTSYSTSIAARASSAREGVKAATAATGCPKKTAFFQASTCFPREGTSNSSGAGAVSETRATTLGRSSPVSTA
jgi:hypothetical protein